MGSSMTLLEQSTNMQGNSMINLSGMSEKPRNPQGNSMASIQAINPQGNIMAGSGRTIVGKPINPQVNRVASIGTSVQYTDFGQGNSVTNVNQQDDSNFVAERAAKIERLQTVYDSAVGSMVYLLDKNQTIDGLEPFIPPTRQVTTHNTGTELRNQSTVTFVQPGKVNEVRYGNPQGGAYESQVSAYASNAQFQSGVNPNITANQSTTIIDGNMMQVQPTYPGNVSYLPVGSTTMTSQAYQSANVTLAGKNVDVRSGAPMPSNLAQVDGQKALPDNTGKPLEKPVTKIGTQGDSIAVA